MTQRTISILGATGSIGASTLDLIRRERDQWRVVALTAHSNAVELAKLAREFSAEIAVISDEARLSDLREALAGTQIETAGGLAALNEAAARPADITIAAIVGCAGLAPTMAAIENGGIIGLANKESLVSAGKC
jgi:1-deoxy-D-xylulose-5-phosphate reductoisomerase